MGLNMTGKKVKKKFGSGINLTNNEIKDKMEVIRSLENRKNLTKGTTRKFTLSIRRTSQFSYAINDR